MDVIVNDNWGNSVIYVDLIYCKLHFMDMVSDLNTTDIVSMKVVLFQFEVDGTKANS
jgi:hypothetical protein